MLWPFLALLLAPRWHRPLVALMLFHLLAWSLYGQLLPAVLPRWFEHGTGLTGAKIGFEFALVGAYLLLGWLLQRRPSRLRADLLAAGLLVLAAGVLFFTLYRDAAGLANLLGHVFKLLGQAFFLRAVLLAHIIDPLLALRLETQQREAWAQRLLDLFRGAPEGIMVVNPQGEKNFIHYGKRFHKPFHCRRAGSGPHIGGPGGARCGGALQGPSPGRGQAHGAARARCDERSA